MADQKHAVHSGARSSEQDAYDQEEQEYLGADAAADVTAGSSDTPIESSQVGHTPLPWKAGDAAWFRGQRNSEDGKRPITAGEHGVVGNVHGKANAEFIVRAVNSHDELIFALKTLADDHRQLLEANSLDRSSAPNGYAAQSLAALTLAKAEGRG